MMVLAICLSTYTLLFVYSGNAAVNAQRMEAVDSNSICVSTEAVPLCSGLLYANTTFPNLRGHTNAVDANRELGHFSSLVQTRCSGAIVHLLCSIYAPMCISRYPTFKFPPCKNLCEYVRDGCADILHDISGYSWPPGPHLDCEMYQNFQDNPLCYGPHDPASLQIPDTAFQSTPAPPQGPPRNLSVIKQTPTSVEFIWSPPEGSSMPNYIYVISCDPQPKYFPLEVYGTSRIALNLMPATKYNCRVIVAHTSNIHMENAASVEFTTDPVGPPQNFMVDISTDQVTFSWDHPDNVVSSEEASSYIYMLNCESSGNNFELMVEGTVLVVQDLIPATEYTCRVSVAPPQNDTTTIISFTTPIEPLMLEFINDTPHIVNNSVHLDFHFNRPVATTYCKILKHSTKQNCSSHSITFDNIPPGSQVLRIAAENDKRDKLAWRIKINIPKQNSCVANLINRRIHQRQNSVTIYFKGFGNISAVGDFECSLDMHDPFICNSPLALSRLEQGAHELKITPTASSCEIKTPLIAKFTVGA